MTILKEYLDHAELAQAAYGNFSLGTPSIDKLMSDEVGFSTEQADVFSKRYRVLATADSYGIGNISGLDAILFAEVDENNNLTGKKILSIRGTEVSLSDIYSDILLIKNGVAYDQTNDLNLFYETLISNNVLSSTDNLEVTGHSLGGVLAQVFSATNPDVVNNTYTYNAPGIGGLTAEVYEILGVTSGNIANANITNIYAKEGIEVTAGLGTLIGSIEAISIDEGYLLQNHSIATLTNSLYIYNMLSEISGVQELNVLTSIMEDVSNEKVIQVVEGVFNDPQNGEIVDKAITLTDNNKGQAPGLTDLTDSSTSQLNSRAPSNLYALLNLNPFAIEGSLPAYADIDPNDYSDMYMSDRTEFFYNHLHDITTQGTVYQDIKSGITNGLGLNKVVFGTEENNNTLSGFSGDDRIYGLAGDDTLVGGAGDDYLEGGRGADTLVGGAGTDYLQGDTGDDSLHGGADEDTLMGGIGNDQLFGDSGEDVLVAGDGADVLVGGANSDTLLGQAGADVLVGGNSLNDLYSEKTYDYLVGGSGFDTYLVSHQDVINDADYSGLIMFNNKSLSGDNQNYKIKG